LEVEELGSKQKKFNFRITATLSYCYIEYRSDSVENTRKGIKKTCAMVTKKPRNNG
jgi:hypothetical protein